MMHKKPPQTFQQVRRETGITARAIADEAKIPLRDEYLYELGAVTPRATKDKILAAFSHLTGHSYQVSDFEPEDHPEPELASSLSEKGDHHS